MPIIKLVPKYCYCPDKPNANDYGLGTVWECDNLDCQAHWELREDQRDGRYWTKLVQK